MTSILSGYSSSLPTDVILGSLVIYIDGTAAYGVTQGEPTVHIPHAYDNLDFDGKIGIPIAGLDRRVWEDVYIEGTFVELNATKALDLEPGGSSAVTTGVTEVTPGLYGDFLTSPTHYKENVRAVMRRGGGGIACVEFNLALLRADAITGNGLKNGTINVRIDARQDPAAASLGVAPYTIKLAAALSTITGIDG